MAEGKEPTFQRQVGSRAWFAAWKFFEKKPRDAILFLVIIVAGGITYYELYGLPATVEQIVPVLIFTVGPIIALWLMLFVWHLWLAPFAIVYEAARASLSEDKGAVRKAAVAINWAPWKHRTHYALYEFAKILAKTDPAAQSMNTEGSAFARLLLQDVNGKKLKYAARRGTNEYTGTSFEITPDYDTEVTRDSALAWAESKQFPTDHVR